MQLWLYVTVLSFWCSLLVSGLDCNFVLILWKRILVNCKCVITVVILFSVRHRLIIVAHRKWMALVRGVRTNVVVVSIGTCSVIWWCCGLCILSDISYAKTSSWCCFEDFLLWWRLVDFTQHEMIFSLSKGGQIETLTFKGGFYWRSSQGTPKFSMCTALPQLRSLWIIRSIAA